MDNFPVIMLPESWRLRAIIWDLDGTLLDSFKVGVDSLEKIMNLRGVPTTPAIRQRLLQAWGKSGSEVISEGYGLSPHIAAKITKQWDFLGDNHKKKISLIPGAAKAVKLSSKYGLVNTLLTSRSQPHGNSLLQKCGLVEYFSFVWECGNYVYKKPHRKTLDLTLDYLKRKCNIRPKECLLVGDTLTDINCGQNAELGETILVRTGPVQDVPDRVLPSSNILNSVADLKNWFRENSIKF